MFYAILAIACALFIGLQKEDVVTIFDSKNPVLQQYKYEYESQKDDLKEEYERGELPAETGYMLEEEYQQKSTGIDNINRAIEARKYPIPKDMKYVPQPTYKFVRYNNPPGTPELNIPRKIEF